MKRLAPYEKAELRLLEAGEELKGISSHYAGILSKEERDTLRNIRIKIRSIAYRIAESEGKTGDQQTKHPQPRGF